MPKSSADYADSAEKHFSHKKAQEAQKKLLLYPIIDFTFEPFVPFRGPYFSSV